MEFDKETYGQRWQVETVMSMIKCNQGDALRSKTYWAQNREMMLKVLTHNIGIILLARELFYRACPVHFFILSFNYNAFIIWSIFSESGGAEGSDWFNRHIPASIARRNCVCRCASVRLLNWPVSRHCVIRSR